MWHLKQWCMLHRGEKCLGKPNQDSFLIRKLSNADAIEFSQWVSLDRAQLVIHVLPREEFIDNLLMTEQHIMWSQGVNQFRPYYKDVWDALSPNQVLITLDFAEHHTFPHEFRKKGFLSPFKVGQILLRKWCNVFGKHFFASIWIAYVANTFFGHWWAQEKNKQFFISVLS